MMPNSPLPVATESAYGPADEQESVSTLRVPRGGGLGAVGGLGGLGDKGGDGGALGSGGGGCGDGGGGFEALSPAV